MHSIWLDYHQQIESLGVKLIKIPTEKNKFRPDSGLLLDVINKNPNANVLILNNPNNPSGVVLYEQEMVEIGEVMLRFPHIIIILDEVYRDLSYVKFISLLDVFPELKARTIVINSCSKGLIGAPDMRIGMVGASKEFITGMAAAQSLSTASVSLFSQLALISGITIKLEGNNLCWETTAINEYKKNMQILSDGFNFGKAPISLVNIPRGGFFALINMRKFIDLRINKASFGSAVSLLYEKIGSDALSDDSAISNYLLYVAGVAVTPGSNFGIDPNLGYVRVSYAVTADKIKKACSNIHKAFFQLKN